MLKYPVYFLLDSRGIITCRLKGCDSVGIVTEFTLADSDSYFVNFSCGRITQSLFCRFRRKKKKLLLCFSSPGKTGKDLPVNSLIIKGYIPCNLGLCSCAVLNKVIKAAGSAVKSKTDKS